MIQKSGSSKFALFSAFKKIRSSAWLLIPPMLALGAFVYVTWFFQHAAWGYLAVMFAWTASCICGYGIFNKRFASFDSADESAGVAQKSIWDVVLLVLSMMAILSLLYDRIELRDIDYLGAGIASARETLNAGHFQTTVFGVFGNVFLYSFIFPMIRCIVGWEDKPGYVIAVISLVVILELAGVSYVMGGRTAILLALTIALACLFVRVTLGKRFLPQPFAWRHLVLLLLCAVFAFGLFFWLRSETFAGGDSLAYFSNMCGHLTSPTALVCDFGASTGPFKDILNYGHLVLLYATHGVWFSDEIVLSASSEGWLTIQGIYTLILERLGFGPPAFAYAGYFIPTPAALIHDFGFLAMVLFGIAFGIALGWVLDRLKVRKTNFWMYVSVVGISFWFLSFLIFPFNLLGFLMTGVIGILLLCGHGLGVFLKSRLNSRNT